MGRWSAWLGGDEPAPDGTIDDAEWRDLQQAALRANPRLAETLGDEATRRRQAAAEQWRKRGGN